MFERVINTPLAFLVNFEHMAYINTLFLTLLNPFLPNFPPEVFWLFQGVYKWNIELKSLIAYHYLLVLTTVYFTYRCFQMHQISELQISNFKSSSEKPALFTKPWKIVSNISLTIFLEAISRHKKKELEKATYTQTQTTWVTNKKKP